MKSKLIGLFGVFLFLVACSSDNKIESNSDLLGGLSARVMYSVALDYLYNDDKLTASTMLKDLIRRHPYTDEAVEASVILIWIHYQTNNFVEAEIEIDSFIRNHPTHKYLVWVQYIKGLVFYEQMGEVTRQQATAEDALLVFKEVLARYKDSKYNKDINLRIETIKDHIAGKQMEIGVYYQEREEHIAAIGRFNEIVKSFNNSVFIEEALYRLVSSYVALGILNEAYYNTVLLGYNYPNSIWYERSYKLLEKTGKLEELKEHFASLGKKWFKRYISII